MPATCFKKAGTIGKKDWESWGMLIKHLFGTSHVIWYKSSFPELLSHSQTSMGRGSPLSDQIRELIVEQFKNYIPQWANARNLGISSSTVRNIVKRFRESWEITAHKRQGRKPTLNARDLQSLRRYCIKNWHQCVKDITTWAQEHFRKPLSVTTVRRYICKCKLKLCNVLRKPFIYSAQKRRRLRWARAHLRWTDAKWKSVLWSIESTFQIVFGNCGRRVLWTKEKKNHLDCYMRNVQKPASVMVWGVLVPKAWATYTYVKAPLMLKGTYRFWSNICCHPSNVFFMDAPAFFSKTMPSHILYVQQQHGSVVKECGY